MIMSNLVLKVLLVVTTFTAITVNVFSLTAINQNKIKHNRRHHLCQHSTRFHLFRRKNEESENIATDDKDAKKTNKPHINKRVGILRNEVKKLDWLSGGRRYDRNAASKASQTEDRHAWKKRNNRDADQGLSNFQRRALYRWRGLKQKIRYLFYRNTVYVLKCEGDKYYVGSTRDRKRRYREHFENIRGGSKWTRLHKPIKVIAEYKRIPSRYLMGMESQKTADYMIKYGVNNVRGGAYCFARNFTTEDLPGLTAFLGHYKQLDYQELKRELGKVLPKPDPSSSSFLPPARDNFRSRNKSNTKFTNGDNNEYESPTSAGSSSRRKHRNYKNKLRKKQRILNKDKARCYKCGEIGHWHSECPNDETKKADRSTLNNPKDSGTPISSTSFQDTFDQWSLPDDV